MDRKSLRKMIQQEIAKVKEDYLVPREEVPPDFARVIPADDHEEDPEAGCGDVPAFEPAPMKKLSCSSCGGPLVMEAGCGCGSKDSESLFGAIRFDNNADYNMHNMPASCPVCGTEHEGPCHKTDKNHAYMAKPQLHKIEKYASELQDLIPDDHDLEDWMRTKISQAADDLGEVYHKLEYKSHSE